MIADLTSFNPSTLQLIIGIILVLGLLIGAIKGLFKCLLGLGCYALFFVFGMFLSAPIANSLSKKGFIEEALTKVVNESTISGELFTTVISTAYNVIAIAIALLLAWILSNLIQIIFGKKLNKMINSNGVSNKLNRILGAVLGLCFSIIISTFILTVIKSEKLFTGGKELIASAGFVNGFDKVTGGIKDAIFPNLDIDKAIDKYMNIGK